MRHQELFNCFVILLKGPQPDMWVCILATQPATLAGLFCHSIYCLAISGFRFSLHLKFLCPCMAKISLCLSVNHLSYVHAPFKGRPRVSFDSRCLGFIFMRVIFMFGVCVSTELSINSFYPYRANNVDIKHSFKSAENGATNKVWTTCIFICLVNNKIKFKVIRDTIYISQIL